MQSITPAKVVLARDVKIRLLDFTVQRRLRFPGVPIFKKFKTALWLLRDLLLLYSWCRCWLL